MTTNRLNREPPLDPPEDAYDDVFDQRYNYWLNDMTEDQYLDHCFVYCDKHLSEFDKHLREVYRPIFDRLIESERSEYDPD